MIVASSIFVKHKGTDISNASEESRLLATIELPINLRLSDRLLLLPIRPAGLLSPLDIVDTTTSQTKQLQRKDLRKR